MNIRQNVSLKSYSTMRLGGETAYECDINNKEDLVEAINWANEHKLPIIIVGSGSNIVWKDEGFRGLLLVDRILGFNVFQEDDENTYLTLGSGEDWDSVVKRSVDLGLSGIEQLSLIPGRTGATPVQNVGAYGREISDVLVGVEAYDSQKKQFVNIPPIECQFGYRTSRFKTTDKGRFFIVSVTLHLTKGLVDVPSYAILQDYFEKHEINNLNPQVIRDAVIDIRRSRLPDPAVTPNTGSFFTNPLVDSISMPNLVSNFPGMKYWEAENGKSKISAAWLIEQAGFKAYKDPETGMATWPNQPLVLVNNNAKSTADLLKFKQKIVAAVQEKFGITLEQEPELLP